MMMLRLTFSHHQAVHITLAYVLARVVFIIIGVDAQFVSLFATNKELFSRDFVPSYNSCPQEEQQHKHGKPQKRKS
ncbi:hypothetical protein ACOJUR_08195 [Alicyclobacillus tolerans]|uniref:hypothetical protein n=1 Tax=Alicyclobacillus tolerans TaxID=90970 RepID=UPI003B80BA40